MWLVCMPHIGTCESGNIGLCDCASLVSWKWHQLQDSKGLGEAMMFICLLAMRAVWIWVTEVLGFLKETNARHLWRLLVACHI